MTRRRQPRGTAEGSENVSAPKGFDEFELRLGDVMRGERATLGKSLLDVQRELKIRAAYIAAIENTDPTAFETPGFIAGYVRSYARYLGLDPEWAYRRFCAEGDFASGDTVSVRAAGSPAGTPKKTLPKRDPFAEPNGLFAPRQDRIPLRIEPGAIGSSLVLLALTGILGYGGWSVLKEIQQVRLAPIDQQPGLVIDVDPLDDARDVVTADSGARAPSTEDLDRLYRPQALDRPVMVARDAPIATLDPGEIGVLAAQPPVRQFAGAAPSTDPLVAPSAVVPARGLADTSVQVVAEENRPEVAVFAVRPAWVRVSAADGTVLLEKILDAGERYVLPETEEAPRLRAGNSGSVYFAVNGQTYGPALPGAQVAKNVELSAEALTEKYALADVQADPDLAVALAQLEATEAQ